MLREVKKNPHVSVREVASELRTTGVDVNVSTVRRRLHEYKYRGYTSRCKPLISAKNRRMRLQFAQKYQNEPTAFWNRVLGTDETKINMFQSDGKAHVWRKRGKAEDPKNTTMSVKFGGGGVQAWASISSSGTGSLVFIDDVTDDGSSIMTSAVFRNIISTFVESDAKKLIGRRIVLQMDNDPKHSAQATKALLKQKKWKVLEWPSQSSDLNPIEHCFHLLKHALRGKKTKNKVQLKNMARDAWESISKDHPKNLVESMPRRLKAVIASKGYATKY